MKRIINFIIIFLFSAGSVYAQQFVEKAVIEYEVKTNIKKTLGNNSWAEMMKENMPQFKTGYYQFTFADNKSVYKFDHWDEGAKIPEFLRKSDEENVWYFDHANGKFNMQKDVFGSKFNVEDSIPTIEWRLTNENRLIAGYNCRKAVGKILDSVYVFAFYTDEITISGGPCSITGLPGMILGLTIPRMYSSWIATKVNIEMADVNKIKPVTAKKYYTRKSLQVMLKDRTKEWFSEDDEDSRKWIEQFYWSTLL
ncbi:MAG TPA: GLPGLI family protein [Ferruginibacter sp.]|nr:GLPGLI family protein [Ferruginibacter sp.]